MADDSQDRVMGVPLGRIQRIDGPQRGALCLSIYSAKEGKSVLLFDARGLHLAERRPHGEPADGFVQRLRRRYTGAHLVGVDRSGSLLRLHLQAKDHTEYLTHEAGALVARDESGKAVAARRGVAMRTWDDERWAPSDVSPKVWAAAATQAEGVASTRLKSSRKKLKRTRAKVEADLARAEKAPALRHEADLLMAHLHLPTANGFMTVNDWLTNTTREIAVVGRPHEQAESLYKRARRYERGVPHIQKRLAELNAHEAKLDALAEQLEEGAKEEELEEAFEGVGIRFSTKATRARRQEARLPYRQFRTKEGRILVGRSARDNDELTLRVARPGDYWLHVRGRPGSHVVIPLDKGQTIHPVLLLDAAHLAAHFSPASKDALVDISHTERRYVRKRRGTPPGSVFLDREKTIQVRRDAERIRRLLKQEVR